MPKSTTDLRLDSPEGPITARAHDNWAEVTGSFGRLVLTREAAAELGEWLSEWARPERRMQLWSRGDIEKRCKVSRGTVQNWVTHATFPKPVGEPASGPVWWAPAVKGWVRHERRGPGRPAKVRPGRVVGG